MAERAKITVRGTVQGVGFRPYVFSLAESLDLKGFVTNTAEGVSIDVEGERLSDFIRRLPAEAPVLSQILEIDISPQQLCGYSDFRITGSRDDGLFTLLSRDVSVCNDCLRELFSMQDRRYLYPFINCTNCGPRYTITKSVPYDRPNTTMANFVMCPECSSEYHNPRNRRFHAQPNACPVCGPHVVFSSGSGLTPELAGGEAILKAIELLQQGAIIAVKGIGGFHIACDASNEAAVLKLRERKRKSNKPFGLMAPNIAAVCRLAAVSDAEESLLISDRRPLVLLRKATGTPLSGLPEAVSPNNRYFGFMLPYTPLHYLLFYHPPAGHCQTGAASFLEPHFNALVMTSGNLSEEPIVRDNDDALGRLSSLVDGFLLHDRDIFMRVDDSVTRVFSCTGKYQGREFQTVFLRRSRGYVPETVLLQDEGPEVLGCGADLKNTFTLTKGRHAILSQHIGDMENYETLQFFEETLANLKSVYRVRPAALGHDLHPGYLSTEWALKQEGVQRIPFQHHYAHIGSVMACHGITGSVIGVAFDGAGYGNDGHIWGSEFLVADTRGFHRAAHFRYVPLPGGDMAAREPWRCGISYVVNARPGEARQYLDAAGFVSRYGAERIEQIIGLIRARELSPLSCSAGRLFDAVSSLAGICDKNTFEGEAAIALEALTQKGIEGEYPFDLSGGDDHPGELVVNCSETIAGILDDVIRGADRRNISTRFHNTLSSVIIRVVREISSRTGLKDVILTGGTFQNLYLLERTTEKLARDGFAVFLNDRVPCNDAGISLGQAYLCRERVR